MISQTVALIFLITGSITIGVGITAFAYGLVVLLKYYSNL